MWTNIQFWKDSTWRAFRTFCQSLAGLLTVQNVSSNLNAPWWTLIYAAAVAGLISFLQSVDRERAVAAAPSPDPAVVVNNDVTQPVLAVPAATEVVTACGDALR
jgi:hypothetical protein